MSKSVHPKITIWVNDLLATIAETGEDATITGARLRLWLRARKNDDGRLPDSDRDLAKWAGVSLRKWKTIRETIVGGWTYDPKTKTFLVRRVAEEIDYTSRKQRAARARWDAPEADSAYAETPVVHDAERGVVHDAEQALVHMPPTPTPTPSPTPSPDPNPREGSLRALRAASSKPLERYVKKSCLDSSRARARTRKPKPKAALFHKSSNAENQEQRSPSPPSAGPGKRKLLLTEEEADRIDTLRRRVRGRSGSHFAAIDRILRNYLAAGTPFSVLERGLLQVLKHDPKDAPAYLNAILRRDGPAERAAQIAREAKALDVEPISESGLLKAILNRGGPPPCPEDEPQSDGTRNSESG